jgi:hypothetical protein
VCHSACAVPITGTILEDASISESWNRETGDMVENLTRAERRRQLFSSRCKKCLALLEFLSNRDIPEYNRVDDPVVLMHLGNGSLCRELLSALAYAGNLSPLTHSASGHIRSTESRDVARMTRPMTLWQQHLYALADDFIRRPAKDLLRAAVEKRDALKFIHADDRIRCNPDDLSEYVVRYSIGHAV